MPARRTARTSAVELYLNWAGFPNLSITGLSDPKTALTCIAIGIRGKVAGLHYAFGRPSDIDRQLYEAAKSTARRMESFYERDFAVDAPGHHESL